MTITPSRTLLPRRVPQPRDDGGKVVTPVRLKATTWLKVQMMADAKGVSASRLLSELVEREIHGERTGA